MTGARWRTFRLGDRSELLAEYFLSCLAFTTRVPRPEDIGFDFFCSLITPTQGQLLKAGPVFTVQAKRAPDAVKYDKDYEVNWVTHLENPFFICVADQTARALNVYSTWNLLCGVLNGWRLREIPKRVVLRPDVIWQEWPGVNDQEEQVQEILLGKPIIRITEDDIADDDRAETLSKVLGEWVDLDRKNIVNRHAGMYWVIAPSSYETGQSPYAQGKFNVAFYRNIKNLEVCGSNMGRVATSLKLILQDIVAQQNSRDPYTGMIDSLNGVLNSHWQLFDEPVKQFLLSQGFQPVG